MKPFDIFNQFAADPSKELEGVWHRIGGGDDAPARILVARSGNKRHSKVITQLYEAAKSILDLKNETSEAKSEEITIESMAKGILLGWENLTFKGRALENGWNLGDAKELLSVRDFRELVNKYAITFADYKAVQDEEDAGN
jgi:hypothetical protein